MSVSAATARPVLEDRIAALRPGMDLLDLPVCVIDPQQRYRYVNPAYCAYSAKAASDFEGRTTDQVFGPVSEDSRREKLALALAGETVIYNRRTRAGPNAGRWVRAHYLPLHGGDGAVVGALVALVDIQQLKDVESELAQRERELSNQEAQLRHFAENIPGPIAVVDADDRYVFANKVYQRIRGISLERMVGRSVPEVLGEQDAARYFLPFRERLRAGVGCSYERMMGPTDGQGESRWHQVRLVPIFEADASYGGFYLVANDIHDMKIAEQRLISQQEQLRLFTDNIPDAIVYLDANRRILFANRQFASQYGFEPEQVIGYTTADVLGAEAAAWIAQRTQPVLDRGEVVTYERLATLAGGERHWLHVKAVPHFDAARAVVGMYVVAHDIHEIKEAQSQLAAREEELRFFAENIPEAICYVDLERGCTFVNNVFLATRGFPRDFSIGKFPEDVYPREVVDELRPHLERAMQGSESMYERRMRLATGEERWVRVRISPRLDEQGVVRGFYVVSTDIHEIKQAHAEVEDKERELRQVIDSIPSPMCYVDADMRYRYVNHAFLDYLGMRARDIVGHPVVEVLGEERFEQLHPHLRRLKMGESLAVERLVRFADGRSRWMAVRLTPRIVDGAYLGYYATTSDIHEQKVVEQELRRANTILSAHFDNTPLAVIEWDTELRTVRWSGQAEGIFGWNAAEALGRPLVSWRFSYEDDEPRVARVFEDLARGPERHATLLCRNYRKDGSVIWVEWHHSALRDDNGRLVSILSLAQDVSSRIQAEERLQYMATHDGLTGLPNSVLLNVRLEAAIGRARRTRGRVGVMFLDLDHFKDVNDSLGHRVGDLLLKELARRIRAALRQSDVLARVSGDEFVIVLEDFPDEFGPEHVARKVLGEVRRPFEIEGHEIHVSASLGLALHPDDGADGETLLKNADAAMYHAKELGRDAFRPFSSELAERRRQRLETEAALRRALRAGELELYFQPIVDVASGAVRRAEALLRWNDPQRGLVLPQSFIPLAEESGLGHAVGHWVLEAACRQARAWREAGLGAVDVCVNLSAGQLRDSSLLADLKRTLHATGCEASWLQFEITETSMVRDVEGASLILGKLRALGVRIAIDDFGTGFSSLSHLRHLPVDVLKIDKGFVADIAPERSARAARGGDGSGGAAIVSAVIGLARGLGLEVVAEGVEKKSQLNFLAEEGCGACQGYLLCPPLPAADFERWLRGRAALAAGEKPATARKRARARRV